MKIYKGFLFYCTDRQTMDLNQIKLPIALIEEGLYKHTFHLNKTLDYTFDFNFIIKWLTEKIKEEYDEKLGEELKEKINKIREIETKDMRRKYYSYMNDLSKKLKEKDEELIKKDKEIQEKNNELRKFQAIKNEKYGKEIKEELKENDEKLKKDYYELKKEFKESIKLENVCYDSMEKLEEYKKKYNTDHTNYDKSKYDELKEKYNVAFNEWINTRIKTAKFEDLLLAFKKNFNYKNDIIDDLFLEKEWIEYRKKSLFEKIKEQDIEMKKIKEKTQQQLNLEIKKENDYLKKENENLKFLKDQTLKIDMKIKKLHRQLSYD